MNNKHTELLEFDRQHIWHPYTSMSKPLPSYLVESAHGVEIKLSSGETLIDGMSSWWSVLHGYNHPVLNQALTEQAQDFSHIMFGGLTHQPAIDLAKKLIHLTPKTLDKVFFSDSGSVAVEVALKMALQYWQSKGQADKYRVMTVRNGYHGDTFAAMSVCDPITGMHQIFEKVLMKSIFAPAPSINIDETWHDDEITTLEALFKQHHHETAAFIIEPIVQGTGGMRFYHPNYLKAVRQLCDQYQILFIADEIATGLGRTGKLFACEWANISPDIMCLGKTLTGGYLTLAATLCTAEIAQTISEGEASCFMHGPTYMANPLACAVANASIDLLINQDWQHKISSIELQFQQQLLPLKQCNKVASTRVLGSIGVVETTHAVNVATIQKRFVELGVWIRPFGKLIYIMPPLVINKTQISQLVLAIKTVLSEDECFLD
ncbi:adenosylmethionine--8-amino-7-oxononanoate transaminase [Thalassotalea castellviae]|uniref:Adenosylmethionine-8-amino-7-oxononanoate aminotransferase n=1 Tax=Thalassotalea castellviae TaxID=3075612 RepID=A0ABU2ZWR0_9GAMM|nr:adenosylmethionine--8-amino-7-oxononanoate transaminase [Thalassotalea sp. W431]MDT0602043.1 adenosylmethionine--8-amino-7-oxononanoate transaminase [Thalassotalea sp. W431]